MYQVNYFRINIYNYYKLTQTHSKYENSQLEVFHFLFIINIKFHTIKNNKTGF
jgi:hypothetical protein